VTNCLKLTVFEILPEEKKQKHTRHYKASPSTTPLEPRPARHGGGNAQRRRQHRLNYGRMRRAFLY
jgi:hypothetical protein